MAEASHCSGTEDDVVLLKCHGNCSRTAVIAAARNIGALGQGISDQETLNVLKAKRKDGYYMALCPAHKDRVPSLSLKIILDTRTVEVPWGDPVAVYPYADEHGELLYEFVRQERYVDGRREKKLRPRLPGASRNGIGDVRRVLYRLPEVIANQIICIVEGEKDVEALRSHGFVGTCNPFGAGKWRDEYSEFLAGKDAIIIPDNDTPGRTHALDVARRVFGIAATLAIVEVPGGCKDIADWFAAGHSETEFIELLEREAFA